MEALQHLRERNKSGDKKAYYDAIEKELKVLEILKEHADSWCGKAEGKMVGMEIDLKSLKVEEYIIIKEWLETATSVCQNDINNCKSMEELKKDWLQSQQKKVGDQICIQGDDGCSGCVLGLLNCVVSYPETKSLQQVFDDTVKMMDYKNKNIIQAIQEELDKDAK